MDSIIKQDIKTDSIPIEKIQDLEIESKKYGCPVCGEDEWCGTDGCPMDPQ
jgi:hypothetical protein